MFSAHARAARVAVMVRHGHISPLPHADESTQDTVTQNGTVCGSVVEELGACGHAKKYSHMQAPDDAEALLPPSGDPDAVPWADDEAAKKKQRRVVSCATRWSPEEEQALLSTVSAISTEGPPRAPGKLSRREWDVVAERMGDARSSSSISQHYLIMIGLRRNTTSEFDFTRRFRT